MECEVRKEGDDPVPIPVVSILEEQVKVATDKLLLTNFPACLETCRHVTAAASRCDDSDSDTVERWVLDLEGEGGGWDPIADALL